MRSQGDNEVEANPRRENSRECKPLLDIATQDIFRKNAFRITGLPVDATAREITKHIDKLKQMTELGITTGVHNGPLALSPPPKGDDIREAHQNLNDPERRILDEFFWFWPEDFGHSQTDAAIQAVAAGDCDTALRIWAAKETNPSDGVVAMHNLAVFWQVKALDTETGPDFDPLAENLRKHMEKYWRDALKRWSYLSTDDVLWAKVSERVRQTAEARLTTGFVRRMRATLPVALRKVHAQLALSYSQSSAKELAKMHIAFMRGEDNDSAVSDRTADLTLAPTTTRIREHIRSAKRSADASPEKADRPACDLIELALPLLDMFDLFYGEAPHPAKDLLDEVATTCISCLVAYQRSTGDNRVFFKLLERTLPIAETVEVRKRIQDNIQIGKDNWAFATLKGIQESKESPRLKLQRFRREAVPAITAAAKISAVSSSFGPLSADPNESTGLVDSAAIVLRNISLDSWNNHRDQTTAIEANELALQYATKLDLRARLTDDRLTMGHASPPSSEPSVHSTPSRPPRQKSKLEKLKINKGFVVAAGVVLVVILANVKSCDTPSSSVTTTSQPPPVQTTQRWDDTKRVIATTPQPQFTPRTQPTYRVPQNTSAELDGDKQAIDSEKAKAARLDALLQESTKAVKTQKATVDELDTNLETLSRQIERDRIYLDHTSQYDIDSFNLKVNRYNSALRNRKSEVEVFNQLVDSRNKVVQQLTTQNRQVNELVDSYNAKLQRYGR